MNSVELRNLDEARDYLLQGLWFQRVVAPTPSFIRPILEWAMEIVSSGQPLPPIGFVADLGNLIFGNEAGRRSRDRVEVPGWSHLQARNYEDHLLGKIYGDWTFERATDAIRRFDDPRDRIKGLAFVVKRIQERGRLGGVELSPAVIRGMTAAPPESLLSRGYESLSTQGPHPLLLEQYEALSAAARRMADVLAPEDVVALEQRTAIAEMGQYIAHRQILQITSRMEELLPLRPVRPLQGRKEVPTRVMDEDQYPVGGYTSISTKGSIESLLHSQLAYMETDGSPGDLFDLKFARDELFYYSRDENQFLRRRRRFLFVFDADLVAARFKDTDLPTQRIVLLLAVVLTSVRRLTDWLSTDALTFELVFLHPNSPASAGTTRAERLQSVTAFLKTIPLAHEAELLEILLHEMIEREAVELVALRGYDALESHCEREARTSQVQCLLLGIQNHPLTPEGVVVSRLIVDSAKPTMLDGNGRALEFDAEEAFDHWVAVVNRLLALWV